MPGASHKEGYAPPDRAKARKLGWPDWALQEEFGHFEVLEGLQVQSFGYLREILFNSSFEAICLSFRRITDVLDLVQMRGHLYFLQRDLLDRHPMLRATE